MKPLKLKFKQCISELARKTIAVKSIQELLPNNDATSPIPQLDIIRRFLQLKVSQEGKVKRKDNS
jgi:hypothetical protein